MYMFCTLLMIWYWYLAGVDDGVRKIELVEVAKYLLVIISGDRRIEGEIRNRIGKASRVINGEEEGAE